MLKKLRIVIFLFFAVITAQADTQKVVKLNWENLSQKQYVENLVECQSAIKELEWSYSLWPKENKDKEIRFKIEIMIWGGMA
jgi:hypothetical protein